MKTDGFDSKGSQEALIGLFVDDDKCWWISLRRSSSSISLLLSDDDIIVFNQVSASLSCVVLYLYQLAYYIRQREGQH